MGTINPKKMAGASVDVSSIFPFIPTKSKTNSYYQFYDLERIQIVTGQL